MRKITSLALAAMMVTATFVGCGGGSSNTGATSGDGVTASGEFDWRAFEGEEITVLFSEHTYADAVEEKLDEFTEKTGIKVSNVNYRPVLTVRRIVG